MKRMYKSFPDSLVLRIGQPTESGCRLWLGAVNKDTGYGAVFRDGKVMSAHRASYEFFVAKIKPHLELDHVCRNRSCVNPWHLEQVTRIENIRRSPISSRARANLRTHCAHGHERNERNMRVYVKKNGWLARLCLVCASERWSSRNRSGGGK